VKREEIGILIRRGEIHWVSRLPDTRRCMMTVIRSSKATSACSSPAGWVFTAGPTSVIKGGPFCWSHLMRIMSRGEEQVRLEDLLKTSHKV
jgi:hypothetical protein